VLVRYVHPVNSGAVVVRFDGVDVDTGLIPKPLCRHSQDWPKSITRDPWADLERPGAVRHGERELLWELHGDYLQAETAYEREQEPLVTDGGQDVSGTDRIDQGKARKDRGLLKHDYAQPCVVCGGVVFEWWDSETCRDCGQADDSSDNEQTTLTDGGLSSAETEWFRSVTSRDEIRRLADDIQLGTHNMWVDIRSRDDPGDVDYLPVSIDVTVTVTGHPDSQPPITDGGRSEEDAQRRDPMDNPTACSKCGVHIGLSQDDYCESCAREVGAKPPLQRCLHCGDRLPQEQMESVDISGPDEYYPEIRYFCRDCSGGDGDE